MDPKTIYNNINNRFSVNLFIGILMIVSNIPIGVKLFETNEEKSPIISYSNLYGTYNKTISILFVCYD